MNINQRWAGWKHTVQMSFSYVAYALFLTMMTSAADGTPAYGVPPEATPNQPEARDLILQSAQATEHAWEEFHSAAIGGTLASPAVQSNIERQLHEARALLMEARHAERANRFDSVKTLTQSILRITQNIVQASREKKQ